MKNLFAIIILLMALPSFSQTRDPISIAQPAGMSKCMTREQKDAFDRETVELVARYRRLHPDYVKPISARGIQRTLFAWPMRASSDYDIVYNYFNLQNYVDQDPDVGTSSDDDDRDDHLIEDYQCNNRTYDSHRGQDINLYPFWWRMMDNNNVMAVAAAPGILLSKTGHHFDKNCSCVEPPNIVRILHDDGSVSSYWHLKRNSLTSKTVDDPIGAGEFLGFIGSSGCSSWPHLHFEVHDENDNVIEPFSGTCNVKNTQTWWQNQRPYWDPQINRLMTHSASPTIGTCPSEEVVNAKNQFNSSEVMYTGIAFMDGQDNDEADCSLIRPNGTTFSTWTTTLSQTNSRDYKSMFHVLPSGNSGTWTFRVVYRGRTYAHFFTVGCTSNETVSGTVNGNDGHIVGDNLTSTAVHTGASNTRILYQSASEIELKPGFEANGATGLNFKARIKPCNYAD